MSSRWESAYEHARILARVASGFSLKHTDASVIARAWDDVADAWAVAADALEERGFADMAEAARRAETSTRKLAHDRRTRPFVLAVGHVDRRGQFTALGEGDYPFETVLKHVRDAIPVQPLAIEGRRIRLETDIEEGGEAGAPEILEIYSDPPNLRRLVRALERGTGGG